MGWGPGPCRGREAIQVGAPATSGTLASAPPIARLQAAAELGGAPGGGQPERCVAACCSGAPGLCIGAAHSLPERCVAARCSGAPGLCISAAHSLPERRRNSSCSGE